MNKDLHLWNSRIKSMEMPKHSHIAPSNKDILGSCVLLDDMYTLSSHDTSSPFSAIIGSCINFKHNTSHYTKYDIKCDNYSELHIPISFYYQCTFLPSEDVNIL